MLSSLWAKLTTAGAIIAGLFAVFYRWRAKREEKRADRAEDRAAIQRKNAEISRVQAEEQEHAATQRRIRAEARRNGDRSGGLSNERLRDSPSDRD